jgi:hypothetical protein
MGPIAGLYTGIDTSFLRLSEIEPQPPGPWPVAMPAELSWFCVKGVSYKIIIHNTTTKQFEVFSSCITKINRCYMKACRGCCETIALMEIGKLKKYLKCNACLMLKPALFL